MRRAASPYEPNYSKTQEWHACAHRTPDCCGSAPCAARRTHWRQGRPASVHTGGRVLGGLHGFPFLGRELVRGRGLDIPGISHAREPERVVFRGGEMSSAHGWPRQGACRPLRVFWWLRSQESGCVRRRLGESRPMNRLLPLEWLCPDNAPFCQLSSSHRPKW